MSEEGMEKEGRGGRKVKRKRESKEGREEVGE